MNKAVEWFAENPVAANLLMFIILAGGFLTIFNIEQEVFPEFSMDMIQVTMVYLGAAPEEVEEGVCIRIEEEIQGLEGIKEITSTAGEGLGTVLIELELGADIREVLDDVKTRIDAIDTFPEETEKPIIRELTNQRQVVNIAICGDADEGTLKHLGERTRDEISALEGITLVSLTNVRPYEISIEVSEDALRKHGISFDFVADAIRKSSLDLPGGSIKTEGGEILLRTKGQAYRQREFENLVLLTHPDGTHLLLGDVARVDDGFADTDQASRFDGKPSVMVQVFRTGDQAALQIADEVKEYVAAAGERLPAGVSMTMWRDDSKVLRDRLDLLLRNGRNGFILVFICLALFLKLRLSFWVSLGIPVSFLGAMWLMPGLDVSVNLISLFAFIVVLGIVVDDAIIVGENIFSHQSRGRKGRLGAVSGAKEVMVPVIFAVLTTVAAFFPLLTVPGTMGKVMRTIPLIVIPCLLFSLTESLLILPAHLAHAYKENNSSNSRNPWYKVQSLFARGLKGVIERFYSPLLERSLRWRYLTIALGAAILILTVGIVGGGWIRFIFFPPVEADYISASLTMPQGTPVEVTSEAVRRMEASAETLRREIIDRTGLDMFRHVNTSVGNQPYKQSQQRGHDAVSTVSASHIGEVTIELAPAEVRTMASTDMANRWRELTGIIPDAVDQSFSASLFSPGEDINVQLTGADIEKLRDVARILKSRLAEFTGVYEIADSFREGKKELKLKIKPGAELLGLTLANLARQVRQAFYGEEAQRIQRGRDDIRVMVRYPEDERRSLGDLENMRIRTPAGGEVPFGEVAEVEYGRGFASIKRVDRRRAVNVTALVDDKQATPSDIIADLKQRVLPEIMANYPGILYSFEGREAERRDSLEGLMEGFLLALIMIFALLAVPLKSYSQPLLIMTAIPFGLVGAVIGHMIMGMDLTILSMFGLVALAGVVVNDSLVMVDFINRARREGLPLVDSVRQSGSARFRPILLTSLTTFAGLAPLILEKSLQAKFLIPMGVSLAFGVLFSTGITLFLIPCGYLAMEDVRKLFTGES